MCAVTLGILQVSVFFTTIYLHRSLTHRALELHPVVAFLMHLAGVVPRRWIAVHRKHHHFSDEEGDPHSPYQYGLWKVLLGNHFYYIKEASNAATIRKYAPDYKEDLLDKLPFAAFGCLAGLGIFVLMFGVAWGGAAWVFHSVVFVLLVSTINSVCHMIGYRNYDNTATNLQWVALLTGGEGLHNNHHEYPTSARLSCRKWEIDPAWPAIRVLEKMGLAKVKRLPLAKAA
jgi:stearoyl-CoA desaturase (delta-9 desaturase)